jgi:hypothetical protein
LQIASRRPELNTENHLVERRASEIREVLRSAHSVLDLFLEFMLVAMRA